MKWMENILKYFKEMETRTLITIIIVIAALLATITLVASEPDTLMLEEIVVKSASTPTMSKTNISGRILKIENAHDGGSLFVNQIGFGIEKRGNYGMEPVLRGFKYSQLNVLIDGGVQTTNACPNRMDPAISQVAMEEIEKIEVIKGPYSVRFGQSFGGVINIVNRKPDRYGDKKIKGMIDAGYQTNGNNFYSNAFIQAIEKSFDLSLNAGYKNFGNYISGEGQKIASSFTRTGYAIKLGYNPAENQRIQLSWRQSKADDVLYAGLPMDADWDKSNIVSLDYAAGKLSHRINGLRLKLYGSFVDHRMSNTLRPAFKLTESVSHVTANVIGGRSELIIQTARFNLLHAGLDFKQTGKDGTRERLVHKNICTGQNFDPPKAFTDQVWQDSKQSDLGLFIENNWQINPNLLWSTGIRSDFIGYAIGTPDDSFREYYGSELTLTNRIDISATSSISWSLPREVSLSLAVARASRAPELSELFINHFNIGMDAYEYLGNPRLRSEVNYQTDIRAEKQWGRVVLFGDIFYSYIQDFISAAVDTTIARLYMPCQEPKFTKVFTNVDQVFLTGFEAGADFVFARNWLANIGISYTYAHNISWGEPLAEISPLTLLSSITYEHSRFMSKLNLRVAADQNRVSSHFNESATPGFALLDLYVSYRPFKPIECNLTVKNLTNANYVEHLSRAYKAMDIESLYYEPGISLHLGVRFTF